MQPLPVCSRDWIHTPGRLCIKTVTATRPPSFCRVNAFVRLSGSGIKTDSWLATHLDLYETKWLAGCGGAEAEDGRRNVFRVALARLHYVTVIYVGQATVGQRANQVMETIKRTPI